MKVMTKKQLIDEVEQLRVQLAGCGVAALGYIKGKHLAKKGDYGWSVAYQDVVNLRKRLNNMEIHVIEKVPDLEKLDQTLILRSSTKRLRMLRPIGNERR